MSTNPVGIKGSAMIEKLAQAGYFFILPDRDYIPLIVTKAKNKNDHPEILGPVTSFVKNPKKELPFIRKDEPKWNIADSYEDKDKASIELSTNELLSKVLKSVLGINITAKYSGFDSVKISFNKVTSDSIYQTELMDYLNEGLVTDNQSIKRLCDKSGKCFVIYDTLKAQDFSISFINKKKTATDNEINLFLKSAGVSSLGDFSEIYNGSIIYSGTEPQTFAFKGIGFYLIKNFLSSGHHLEFRKRTRGLSEDIETPKETSADSFMHNKTNRDNSGIPAQESYKINTEPKINFNAFEFI
ncbi:MAG: hypothetical protein PHI15_04395 [Methanomicrobium sp.]|nr:hypothetical protein [Methanomicrobium sp.]